MPDLAELEKSLDDQLGTSYGLIGHSGILIDALRDLASGIGDQSSVRFELDALGTAIAALSNTLACDQRIALDGIVVRFVTLVLPHIQSKKASKDNSRKGTDGRHAQHRADKAEALTRWDRDGATYSSVKAYARHNAQACSVTPETLAR